MNTTHHIDHLDESVMRTLQEFARREHVSIEEAARRALARLSNSVEKRSEQGSLAPDKNEVLLKQAGRWSATDREEFERNTAPFREIDPDLWK